MTITPSLLASFEADRDRLRTIAQRLLGSSAEAEDAVQEAWLRIHRDQGASIEKPAAWFTTVVSRIAIDMLRARGRRAERALEPDVWGGLPDDRATNDPERDLLISDAVGAAMLTVLDRLRPRERVAFVLHDTFGLAFTDIAKVLDCSVEAARQLASRARRIVQTPIDAAGRATDPRKQALVDAFFAASRRGDFAALLKLLDERVVLRIDPKLSTDGRAVVVEGAREVAGRAQLGAQQGSPAHVDLVGGEPSIVIEAGPQRRMVMHFVSRGATITAINIIAYPGAVDEGRHAAQMEGIGPCK